MAEPHLALLLVVQEGKPLVSHLKIYRLDFALFSKLDFSYYHFRIGLFDDGVQHVHVRSLLDAAVVEPQLIVDALKECMYHANSS
ncbi:hypothetical protein D3C84_1207780 [compost metagenome]